MQQGKMPGTAKVKRNCWCRGNGACSFRGELKRGIAMIKRRLNRKVRRRGRETMKGGAYKRICRTVYMVDFS